ncbi:MAG: O-antigen ligase family protein [Elusimicrobia bacterium]|nr:O-antigen ligase family protein [Elusimicrobiota bacterium]
MLPLLIGLLVAVGPLLRAGWDLWAQSLLWLCVTWGCAAWALGRLTLGFLPLPQGRWLAWAGALALLSAVSAWLSPVPTYSGPAWRTLLLGLWIFPATAMASKDARSRIDIAVQAAGWILVLLAFHQYWREASEPSSTFLNRNVFAGTILLLLPLSVQRKDWLLASALVLVLIWARSAGAWLGLAGALVLTRRDRSTLFYWLGLAVGFLALVAVYAKLQSPEVMHRWQWWSAAARMIWDRPLTGFGPGAFAYVLPAYEQSGRPLSTMFAHQHFLETAAECGLPFLGLWAAGLFHFLRRGGAHKRFGAVAVLVQSLWDYPLSVPANLWLFCYFAASSIPQSPEGVNVRLRMRLAGGLAVLLIAGTLSYPVWTRWQADRLKARAVADPDRAKALALLHDSLAKAKDAEAETFAAQLHLASKNTASLREALQHLQRSARLNPYRASTWSGIERIFNALGQPERAAQARTEGERYCPILRAPAVNAR